jgi:uncharacterized membrane protein YeaQ/YmgE (transglycosylase-associated protein family)
MINILAWIAAGGLVGRLASAVGRGAHLGVIGDIAIGVLGAVIAGVLFSWLLPAAFGIGAANLATWGIALFGAVTLLFLVRAMSISTRSPTRR